MNSTKTLRERLTEWGLAHIDFLFWLLRWLKPTLVFGNFAVVTRYNDVEEVLARDGVFHVPYESKMRKVTAGENFFLGMENIPAYTRDVSNMRLAVRRDDIPVRVKPFVERTSNDILAASGGRIDLVTQLTQVVPTRLVADYFGMPGWDEKEYAEAASVMFQYLFYPDDPAVEQAALPAAARTRPHMDAMIAARKRQRGQHDDVLERCLVMQDAGLPGMTDLDIRNNLIGLIIGAIPTTAKSAAVVIDHLLSHPVLLADAQRAARANDDRTLVQYVLECLRLNPFAAGVQRVCSEDYVVARGSWRATRIPAGTAVLAATQSAMRDGRRVNDPSTFRLDRPAHHYMHFGYGLHTCFGYHINLAQIPAIVKAVLQRPGLRRAPLDAGRMVSVGPFPVRLVVEFDAA
jgi:cytochrome P450